MRNCTRAQAGPAAQAWTGPQLPAPASLLVGLRVGTRPSRLKQMAFAIEPVEQPAVVLVPQCAWLQCCTVHAGGRYQPSGAALQQESARSPAGCAGSQSQDGLVCLNKVLESRRATCRPRRQSFPERLQLCWVHGRALKTDLSGPLLCTGTGLAIRAVGLRHQWKICHVKSARLVS